jgi:S-adenosylmethionine hydrolase
MRLITFTTDFGADSPYVAQMKAVALRINAQAR